MSCSCNSVNPNKCCGEFDLTADTLFGIVTVLAMHDFLVSRAETPEERVALASHSYESFIDLLPEKYREQLSALLNSE